MRAHVLTATLYSYTEAGFRMLNLPRSLTLLAITGASGISKLGNPQLNSPPSELMDWSATGVRNTSILAHR
jgi:hypothetical protein